MGALSPAQLLLGVAVAGIVLWLVSRGRKAPPRSVASNQRPAVSTSAVDDPYAPPQSDEDEAPAKEPVRLATASQSARFLNSVIDTIVLAVLSGGSKNPGVQLLFMFGYYWGLETLFGATVGKRVTGTRVVAVDGGQATAWQILGRTLIRFLPIEAFSFMSSNPVGWHDRWSNTRVVSRSLAR